MKFDDPVLYYSTACAQTYKQQRRKKYYSLVVIFGNIKKLKEEISQNERHAQEVSALSPLLRTDTNID